MNWLSLIKIAGPIAAAIALFALFHSWSARGTELAARHACDKAISTPTGDLKPCPAPVTTLAWAARAAADCDAALDLPAATGGFAVRQVCSEPVKRVIAERDAAAAERDNALQVKAEAEQDRDASIARAEARGQAHNDKVTNDAQIIQSAPHAGDGTIHCDAECLRRLATP